MTIIALVGYIALYCNYWLLSKYDANFVMGLVYPLSIIMTAFIGWYFYEEKISSTRWVGLVIVSLGVIVIYCTK